MTHNNEFWFFLYLSVEGALSPLCAILQDRQEEHIGLIFLDSTKFIISQYHTFEYLTLPVTSVSFI